MIFIFCRNLEFLGKEFSEYLKDLFSMRQIPKLRTVLCSGLFKKKNQDKKSPSGPRKESRKDHNKKSREDLTDAG